jgi:hypothetical protein
MQEACNELAEYRRGNPVEDDVHPPGRRRIVALGMPVISSLTHYDGEEYDDMRVPQARLCSPPLTLKASTSRKWHWHCPVPFRGWFRLHENDTVRTARPA